MEGHPESFISSKNQQLEPLQLEAQDWTPIHSMQLANSIERLTPMLLQDYCLFP
jgi:hypothetical protein